MARQKLNQLIAQGKTEEAFSILLQVELKEEEVHKQVIMLSGQYHQWKRQDQLGLEPAKSDLRRIESALFDLIQTTEIPPLPEADPPPPKDPPASLSDWFKTGKTFNPKPEEKKEPLTPAPEDNPLATDPFADFKSMFKNSGIDWTKSSYGDGSKRTQAMNLAQQPRVLLTSPGITADLRQKVYELEQTEFIKEVSIVSRNNWVILRDRSRFWHGPGVASDMGTKLWEFYNAGEEIKHVALAPNNQYVILRGFNSCWFSGGIRQDLKDSLWQFYHAGEELKHLAFSPEGAFVLLRARSAFWASGDCPPELVTKLWEFYHAGEEIKQVAMGPHGRFVILRGRNGFWHSGNLPPDLKDEIWRLNQGSHTIRRVYFCDADDWVILL